MQAREAAGPRAGARSPTEHYVGRSRRGQRFGKLHVGFGTVQGRCERIAPPQQE